ncbi:hypothetical protein TNCV_4482971 [Trichonephila clavipes]|nr:hypothetical protein TNCV_4482971 [Trichonephila clavipes]
MFMKAIEARCPAIGVIGSVWFSTRSDIVLDTRPRLKITRSEVNNPRVALYCAALNFTRRDLEAWREN